MLRRSLISLTLLIAAGAVGATSLPSGAAGAPVAPASAGSEAPVPSPGCGSSTAGGSREVKHTLQIGGVERWYLLTTPPAHDGHTPVPLVLDFHGLGEGAQIHTLMSEFSPLAETEGFAVAFPQGQFNPVRWDINANSNPNTDLAFVDAMLHDIGQQLCIDTARVYASGLSYGAFMTSFLTCQRADRFAAVAAVAGLIVPTPCPQRRPVPILTFHGTADPILFFNGGVGQIGLNVTSAGGGAPTGAPVSLGVPPDVDLDGPGFPANAAAWAASNGCNPDKTDTQLTPEVIHRVWSCPAGADVEFYIVLGGGHAWPGSEFSKAIAAVVGYTTFDIDATELAWRFFERFRLPCASNPTCAVPPDTSSTTAPPSSTASSSVAPGPGSNPSSPAATATAPSAVLATPRFTG